MSPHGHDTRTKRSLKSFLPHVAGWTAPTMFSFRNKVYVNMKCSYMDLQRVNIFEWSAYDELIFGGGNESTDKQGLNLRSHRLRHRLNNLLQL